MTTAPAPTCAPLPTVTPGRMTAPTPRSQPSSSSDRREFERAVHDRSVAPRLAVRRRQDADVRADADVGADDDAAGRVQERRLADPRAAPDRRARSGSSPSRSRSGRRRRPRRARRSPDGRRARPARTPPTSGQRRSVARSNSPVPCERGGILRSLTTRGARARKPLHPSRHFKEEPMQVTISEISPVEKKVAVEIPWPYVAQKLDEAYKDLSRGVALKGFRKGKVPRPMLEKMFGRQVEQEVVKQLVQESFVTAATAARPPAGGRADRRRRASAQGAVVPLLGARRGALDRRAEGLRGRRAGAARRPPSATPISTPRSSASARS